MNLDMIGDSYKGMIAGFIMFYVLNMLNRYIRNWQWKRKWRKDNCQYQDCSTCGAETVSPGEALFKLKDWGMCMDCGAALNRYNKMYGTDKDFFSKAREQ